MRVKHDGSVFKSKLFTPQPHTCHYHFRGSSPQKEKPSRYALKKKKTMKNFTWKRVLELAVTIITAILTTLTTTACAGF